MRDIASAKVSNRFGNDKGQTTIIVLLVMGLFLLGAVAFAVDFTSLWFHRQSAQTAADAACTAAAMDMLLSAESIPPPGTETAWGNFTPASGTTFDCASMTTAAPCQYAALNGYNGSGLVAGSPSNTVKFSFSNSFSGLASCFTNPPPKICLPGFPALPIIQVNVGDRVKVFFAGMISGAKTMDVGAQAICGVVASQGPVPILVLDPQNPKTGSALSVQGTPSISIVGGPTRSIQVNSNDAAAVSIGGSATIDLSKGGPNGTGSDLGVYGGPTTAPKGFSGGTTGQWASPSSPVSDPFAQLAAPAVPTYAGTVKTVLGGVDGCPLTAPATCDEYTAGHWTTQIDVKNTTAIFVEGVYYLDQGLLLDSNSIVRPSTASAPQAADQIGGTMFYFSGSSTVTVASNSGGSTPTAFNTTSGSGVLANGVKCTATSSVPANLPATVQGNILLAPCTGTYGDPLLAAGLTDTLGTQRGMLFFQDRSATGVNPSWGGGGQFLLAGTMYFHSCNSSGTGTGCGSASTYYGDNLTLQGNSGSGTYVLGNIITDNLSLGGTSGITMDLNPNPAYWLLKASLLP